MFYRWNNSKLILTIRVQTRSDEDKFTEMTDEYIKLRVTAPPIDGKANAHIISFLAKQFDVKKSNVTIKTGATAKNKQIVVHEPKQLPDFINHLNIK